VTLKYITGHGRAHTLDVAAAWVDCIISYISSIKFSSNDATGFSDCLLHFIGRLRISPRVKSGKVRVPWHAGVEFANRINPFDAPVDQCRS
jgi:hypothetical protein